MTRPPILPGMVAAGTRFVAHDHEVEWIAMRHRFSDASPDYADYATCGVLMAWCHIQLAALIGATHPPLRPRLNIARVALNEARPWDGPSVERAVKAVCEVLP